MIQTPWRHPPLTQEEADDLFMLLLEDDTEEAPWMVMGDLQFWSASSFAHSLHAYAQEQGLPWYVASMLPIAYDWPNAARKKVLSPDTFVAFVPQRARTSYDLEEEGVFPPFVLEVVSPTSTTRDQHEKRHAYELLGAQEYALFTPREDAPSTLEGYRRGATGQFERWPADAEGRLWSEVLGLYLLVRGALLQAQTVGGELLLTLEQSAKARRQEAEARQQAETERMREAEARQQAETERMREAEARQQAETERMREAEARQRAETERMREAEARQQAEQTSLRAQEEIEWLRHELERYTGERNGDGGASS